MNVGQRNVFQAGYGESIKMAPGFFASALSGTGECGPMNRPAWN